MAGVADSTGLSRLWIVAAGAFLAAAGCGSPGPEKPPPAPEKPAMDAAKPAMEKPRPAMEKPPLDGAAPAPEYSHGAAEKSRAPGLVERYARGESASEAGDPAGRALVGSRLAGIRFLDGTGEIIDPSDHAGKKRVVLVILRGFAGTVCINCSTQTLALADAAAEFERRNAALILVYPGPADAIPRFLSAVRSLREAFAPPFPIALDIELAAVRKLGIEASLARPTTIVIDEAGIVRYAHVGRTINDRPSAKEILAVLDGLDGESGGAAK